MKWGEHDPERDAYAYYRHLAKLATKTERQHRMARAEGAELSIVTDGLMRSTTPHIDVAGK